MDKSELLKLIDKISSTHEITKEECFSLLSCEDEEVEDYLCLKAREISQETYGKGVYVRALIEFSNHCRNNCYYCGIRKDQKGFERYRLNPEEILECCKEAYDAGLRTFVMQGAEDAYYEGERLTSVIKEIRKLYPDCAITISDGEHPSEVYKMYKDAGANRFLLRHETIRPEHYSKLHPEPMTIENRVRCLKDCKRLGLQTGSGIMVGTPGQTIDCIVDDIMFLKDLNPEMVGIGPFLPSVETPFENESAGDLSLCIRVIAILRILLPKALLPSTTALASHKGKGRLRGILAGANVVMPNVSPKSRRELYHLYDNKVASGAEAVESLRLLEEELNTIGYHISYDRGDYGGKKNV